MAVFDYITHSFKTDWNANSIYTDLVPTANIYYDRAAQPEGVSGFPYMRMFVEMEDPEQVTKLATYYSLVKYNLTIEVYTVQGQSAGLTSGDAMTDQGNIQRALEAVLNFIPPNVPWNYVTGFLHCLRKRSTLEKDNFLFEGKDVFKSINRWTLLVTE